MKTLETTRIVIKIIKACEAGNRITAAGLAFQLGTSERQARKYIEYASALSPMTEEKIAGRLEFYIPK